ncbi:Gag-polypeptide of LTR copia-type [Sesbania bispinosa]|nr:Gag-polypeptide of LTR copia-type [Sesbania bispinosa]
MENEGKGEKTIKITNPRSPFYVHASDNLGIVLTNVLLSGEENYDNWSKAMKNALKAKNKLVFINGSVKKPDDAESDESFAWEVCNSMINGWIHNTIDPKLQPFIQYFQTAKELWDDLKERHAIQNIARQYQLKSGLPSVKQHGMTLGAYYTKLRAIWDELEDSRSIPSCPSRDKCPVTKHLQEESEKDRVYQFLMGLDDAIFGNLHSQILNTSLLPSINRIYSMAIQEETHKAITRSRDDRIEAVGYVVQASPKLRQGSSTQPMSATSSSSNIDRPVFSHCGKSGHDISRCFQLIGYPQKGTGKGRGKGMNNGGRTVSTPGASANATQALSVATCANISSSGNAAISTLTPEVIQRLLSLVEPAKSCTETLFGKEPALKWLIDSGASHHMTRSLDLFWV